MTGSSNVAVVIVNYRTADLTRAAVASALSEPDVTEVVVVDNASGHGDVAALREAFAADGRVTVVESGTNLGFGQGANLGVARSRSPLVLLLNSDATIAPGSVRLLVQALLADDRVGVVAPAIHQPDGTLQPGVHGSFPRRGEVILVSLGRKAADDQSPDWVSGVAMLLRRRDFEAVGGFDDRYEMYFEDIDLCRRLRHRGKVAARQPAASVVHGGGSSWPARADQVRHFHRSKLRYAERLGAGRAELACIRLLGLVRTAMAGRRRAAVPADGG